MPSHPEGNTQRTEVQYGDENAMQIVLGFLSRARTSVDTCGDSAMPSVAVAVEPVRQFTVGLSGQGLKLRSITEITRENLLYCRELAKYVQLRHMPGIKGHFAVRDGIEYVGTTVLEEAKPITQVISSNVKGMVEQHQYLFETLWSRATPAHHRFKEIEEGVDQEFMRVVADPDEAAEIFAGMARNVRSEAFMLLPDSRSLGMMRDIGVLQHLANATEKGAAVRIISPLDDGNAGVVNWIAKNAPGIRIMGAGSSKSTILLTDDCEYFRAELREAGASEFSASIGFGFAIHSNSRPTVSSFRSFFELLWKSTTLNEELKKADRMQKEFINIAAHELRTPIQPILGYAELLESASGESEEIGGIIRNALRLQRLTNDLLDTAKIESGSLRLNKEQFALDEIIAGAIKDVEGHYGGRNARVVHKRGGDVMVRADRGRIAQVVFNLLSNAAKFADNVAIESQRKDGEVTMTVADDGPGVDPEIAPRLFTKFASKSEQGTGLGLYIAKAIVDAHGGTIFAENNVGGKGVTFTVTLPA